MHKVERSNSLKLLKKVKNLEILSLSLEADPYPQVMAAIQHKDTKAPRRKEVQQPCLSLCLSAFVSLC